MVVGIHDVITPFKFGDDRFWCRSAEGQSLPFPIDLQHSHYRVMCDDVLQKDTKGQVLFDQVCRQLNLIERHCFGLRFVDTNQQRVTILALSVNFVSIST